VNTNTLSLYLYAGGVSLGLSAVLSFLTRVRAGTQLLRSCAYAILMLAVGLVVAGYGPSFPLWATVIGTNLVLLAAGTIFYSGVVAFVGQREPTVDWPGMGLLAISAVAFWYWGLVEPNGIYRSVVFSVAAAVINARIAYQLSRNESGQRRKVPDLVLVALFGIMTIWMLARMGILLFAEVPAAPVRGSNPTTWVTVFWYIVLITAMTLCVVWAEFSQPSKRSPDGSRVIRSGFGSLQEFHSKLLMLWALVLIVVLAAIGEAGVYYTRTYYMEQARLTHAAELTNEALANQTKQVMTQVDTILYAVRNFYLSSRSIEKTEAFIRSLPFAKSVIENVYLISPNAEVVISHDLAGRGRSVADRDYYGFLKSSVADELFIGSAELGRVTQQFNFRVARRVNNPDGSFAGVVLATVRAESLSRYYEKLARGTQSTATVVGILDRKIRARSPALPPDRWQTPLESPLWELLEQSPTGSYTNTSPVDNISRIYVYKKVDDLPLVVATGFSESDIASGVFERLRAIAIGALGVFVVVLTLASLLTIEIRRRAEQGRFLSMLSHELKTPLSTIAMTMGSHQIPDATKQRVVRSIDSMNAIIDRCLQSDRLAHGRVEVTQRVCDVLAIAADVRAACSEPQRVLIEGHDMGPVRTDQQLFSVILSNLVDNALKYGAPDTQVHLVCESANRRRVAGVQVTVTNFVGTTGVPDPKQVFRKYYRASGAQGKVGSGLGLYIAAGFASKLGGKLSYTQLSEQVKFTLWIPA
jgi:two-component sensor histidine kinase